MLRLHRAAVLANIPGYTEMYEYLLYAGADPTIRSNNFSPYLQPGRHLPVDLAPDVGTTKSTLHELNRMYEDKPKAGQPNPFICDWWALYDYGLEEIIQWPADYSPVFPEVRKRQIEREEKEAARERRRQFRASVLSNGAAKSDGDRVADNGKLQSSERPIAILFPGQGEEDPPFVFKSSQEWWRTLRLARVSCYGFREPENWHARECQDPSESAGDVAEVL